MRIGNTKLLLFLSILISLVERIHALWFALAKTQREPDVAVAELDHKVHSFSLEYPPFTPQMTEL